MNIDRISNPSTPDGVSTWKPAQGWCVYCDNLVRGNDESTDLDSGHLAHTGCARAHGFAPIERGSYLVRLMVAGARNQITHRHHTLGEAMERASQWRSSNSMGHYRSQIWLGTELVQETDGTMHAHSTTGLGLCTGCQKKRADAEPAELRRILNKALGS